MSKQDYLSRIRKVARWGALEGFHRAIHVRRRPRKTAMIDSERDRCLRELADRIAKEQDRDVVGKLVAVFNRLIREKIQSSGQTRGC